MKKAKTFISKPETSAPKGALVVFAALFLASCSHKSLGLFFDLPPPKPEAETAEPAEESAQGSAQAPTGNGFYPGYGSHPADRETDRPAIEAVADWEAALALLPSNKKGEPDWSAALRDGIVEPRALDPADRMAEFFKLDFFIKAEKPKNDAWFPHSSHLAWMGCDSCHPAVFKYADNDMSMKAMRGGEGCGACHGNVAFSLKDCKRCHTQK